MAEKRMISKSISISEKVNLLPDIFDMLLFTWLIPHTDDFGRLTGSPAKVKALVVPMLDKTIKDIESSLIRLHEAELILWYEIERDKYIEVIKSDKHQQGLHKRTKSKYPDPIPGSSGKFREIPGSSGKFQEIPPELNRTELNRTEEKGTEQNYDEVSVPTFDNPHKTKILEWIKQYQIEYNFKQYDDLCSYIGMVDIEVIEDAIKTASGKHVPYAVSVLKRLIKEGKTTKESILPKVGETIEKSEGQLRHEQSTPEDKPITGGRTGALPSKWANKVVQMPNVSG